MWHSASDVTMALPPYQRNEKPPVCVRHGRAVVAHTIDTNRRFTVRRRGGDVKPFFRFPPVLRISPSDGYSPKPSWWFSTLLTGRDRAGAAPVGEAARNPRRGRYPAAADGSRAVGGGDGKRSRG